MATREEQKAKRKQVIISKALELFVKKGYADTKIEDIAKASGMSVGLMFHYFPSKEKLYEHLVRIGADGANAPLEAISFDNPLDYFSNTADMIIKATKQEPWISYMFVLMAQTRRSDGVPKHIRDIALSVNQIERSAELIADGQKKGLFRDGNPYAISFAFWCAIQGIMEQLATLDDKEKEKTIPDAEWLVDIIRRKTDD